MTAALLKSPIMGYRYQEHYKTGKSVTFHSYFTAVSEARTVHSHILTVLMQSNNNRQSAAYTGQHLLVEKKTTVQWPNMNSDVQYNLQYS